VKNQLLPEGFRDSLPELATKENRVNSTFIKLMEINGFLLVKPPLLEFESSLFFLLDDNEDANSFRVLDPISQKMMGIRSDITVQIARISCGSLIELPRPLKLCYSGEVLRVNNNSLNLSRQSTQIGSEIIGIEQNDCENEIISLMIESLNNLKIKNFFINFTMPTLISAIDKDFKLSKPDLEFVRERFNNKNSDGLEKVSKRLKTISDALIESVGDAKINLKKLKKINFTKNIKLEIQSFIKIIGRIIEDFPDLKILIDPSEIDESNYHTGIAFKVFSENLKELFSGGNYKVLNENCIGFSGFTESLLLETVMKKKLIKKILIPKYSDPELKKNLQKKGFLTFQSIKKLNKQQTKTEANKQECNYYFFDNDIFKVK
jgi:ATP phosphoribosyltransferase regulatory subunit